MELAGTAELIPLFTTDDSDNDSMTESREIQNTMDVTNKISSIRQIEKDLAGLDLQDRESRAFYAAKKNACEQRMDFLKQQILNYLQARNQKNIQTPAGMAFQRLVTTKHWPSDDVLISWCMKSVPTAMKISKDVDKRILTEHIKAKGEIPDGYLESHQMRLYLK